MKKTFLLIFYLLVCSLSKAQIGINTENPQALLHIDGASTPTTTNPSSGTISAIQASDDIVVSNDGKIGIGTIDPSAKVSIVASVAGEALSLKDGSQEKYRVLMSDMNGFGTWKNIGATWSASLNNASLNVGSYVGYYKFTSYSYSTTSDLSLGTVNIQTGDLTVPFTGYYKVTLSAWFGNTKLLSGKDFYQISPRLYINNTISQWLPDNYSFTMQGNNASFVAVLKLNVNDVLSVYLDRSVSSKSFESSYMTLFVEFYK